MKNNLFGWTKVFSFTFRQHASGKGYRNSTIIVAALCLIIPIVIMSLVELNSDNTEEQLTASNVKQVNVADLSDTDAVDCNFLNQIGIDGFNDIKYQSFGNDINKAQSVAEGSDGYTLLMVIDNENEDAYTVNILLPGNTKLSEDDAESFESFINSSFSYILMQKSGLDYTQVAELMTPTDAEVVNLGESETETEFESVKEIFSGIFPYVIIMLLYFMILAYGQSVANSVIMEKTSKLMDTFLISIKPQAMVLGKTLAIVCTALIQFFSWIFGLAGGFILGTLAVKTINPDTKMGLVMFFDAFGDVSGMFTVSGIVIALMMVIAGFIMYCALAAVGGSMAGKPEDLSTTNMLFTMILVASFLATVYTGDLMGGGNSGWAIWFPFTAMLVLPSRILLGQVSIPLALGSLAITLLCAFLIVLLAGKVYKAMSLYKGKVPNLKQVFGMLKDN